MPQSQHFRDTHGALNVLRSHHWLRTVLLGLERLLGRSVALVPVADVGGVSQRRSLEALLMSRAHLWLLAKEG